MRLKSGRRVKARGGGVLLRPEEHFLFNFPLQTKQSYCLVGSGMRFPAVLLSKSRLSHYAPGPAQGLLLKEGFFSATFPDSGGWGGLVACITDGNVIIITGLELTHSMSKIAFVTLTHKQTLKNNRTRSHQDPSVLDLLLHTIIWFPCSNMVGSALRFQMRGRCPHFTPDLVKVKLQQQRFPLQFPAVTPPSCSSLLHIKAVVL